MLNFVEKKGCRRKYLSRVAVSRLEHKWKKCAKMSQKRAIMSTNIVVLDQET